MTNQGGGGRLLRRLRKLAASDDQLDAEDLQEASAGQGCRKIDEVGDREVATLYGHLKNVSLAPRGGTPTLEATLYDGSGVVRLVWLGRRKIGGISAGATLVVWGRVSCQNGDRIMYNPQYELVA
ncbi:MAG TPA: OB-fold nucleic acid binding domain-containing protein [Nocardioidaceae bacterium]|nr:OB-fold nucleic acid binding domain-containing protein [Nocardioidaceae bacterium]